jgi:hypothetical protein
VSDAIGKQGLRDQLPTRRSVHSLGNYRSATSDDKTHAAVCARALDGFDVLKHHFSWLQPEPQGWSLRFVGVTPQCRRWTHLDNDGAT